MELLTLELEYLEANKVWKIKNELTQTYLNA